MASTNTLLEKFQSQQLGSGQSPRTQTGDVGEEEQIAEELMSPLHPFEIAKLFNSQKPITFDQAWDIVERARQRFAKVHVMHPPHYPPPAPALPKTTTTFSSRSTCLLNV